MERTSPACKITKVLLQSDGDAARAAATPAACGPANDTAAEFRAREIEQVSKKAFPTQRVHGNTARPELRLITGGGDIRDGHRPDSIIPYADLPA
jgi:hypothetical protein